MLTTPFNTLSCSDAAYVRGAVGDVLGLLLQDLMCLGLGLVLALVYEWRMALVVAGAQVARIATAAAGAAGCRLLCAL
jgi:hypothetical protein